MATSAGGPTYTKITERAGQVYVLKRQNNIDDEFADAETLNTTTEELYKKAITLSVSTSRLAAIFRFLNILATVLIIVAGAIIGVLGIISCQNAASRIASSLGFVVTAIQTCLSTFDLAKRTVLLKGVSLNARTISRCVRNLSITDASSKYKTRTLEQYYRELDSLDLEIFDLNSPIPGIIKENKPAYADESPPGSDSDLSSMDSPHSSPEHVVVELPPLPNRTMNPRMMNADRVENVERKMNPGGPAKISKSSKAPPRRRRFASDESTELVVTNLSKVDKTSRNDPAEISARSPPQNLRNFRPELFVRSQHKMARSAPSELAVGDFAKNNDNIETNINTNIEDGLDDRIDE
jgi:ABC-type multidrug transport system fused ATPase/permease subunit